MQNPPEGYSTLTPYLHLDDADAAIAFYTKVLGAKERFRLPIAGKIGHAELTIGDSLLMLSDCTPDARRPVPTPKGEIPPMALMLYVANIDATLDAALVNGAKVVQDAADQFYGDRTGVFRDPFDIVWHIATRIRDVSHDEMREAVSGA